MTAITNAHHEWAVVDRLRAMLEEQPHKKYNVTQAYGLCVAILAWVMQRIRTTEEQAQSPEDRTAVSLMKKLKKQKIESSPWCLQKDVNKGQESSDFDFKGYSAFCFLKWLRNASCHGDARNVFPINNREELVGFEFRSTARGDDRERAVFLCEADLRKIGIVLASQYCEALQNVSVFPNNFANEAQTINEKRIAT
ncbi:hypothetical protein AGMMS49545_01810 [Betaproteobacteria bacterium]|nr:hypothetical protein AGMMS49545_01810 [Betaproteobacteria bacterium]GHU43704.1 hypothetical protein AGMMS50289_10580 [Betaproteobacteria bacterium]